MASKQTAFTLIELMIVVAIIGILAAVAIPTYQRYTIQTQVTEGLSLTGNAKTAVATFQARNGRYPASNASAELAAAGSISGDYVSQVDVSRPTPGQITVVYNGAEANSQIAGDQLVLSAVSTGGALEWVCQTSSTPGTPVPSRYLPDNCR